MIQWTPSHYLKLCWLILNWVRNVHQHTNDFLIANAFQIIVWHYNDVAMSLMVSQITSLTIVYSAVNSGADQIKHQSSASLAFVLGIPRWPANSPHKGSITRKMFPFDDVIMKNVGHFVQASICQMCFHHPWDTTLLPYHGAEVYIHTSIHIHHIKWHPIHHKTHPFLTWWDLNKHITVITSVCWHNEDSYYDIPFYSHPISI